MCGILGYFDVNRERSLFDEKKFISALKLLSHRGPDATGIYQKKNIAMGHTRLSIIDPSSASNQPMVSSCEGYVLIFNGEVYNFYEIKKKLLTMGCVFKTQSDTEVVLNAYKVYGPDCIKHFNGMFALAIYDIEKKEVFIARDRLGIKPLYYSYQNGVFILSSEIKSILALSQEKYKLNKTAVVSYLSFRYPILDDTFFDGVYSLPSASYIILKTQPSKKQFDLHTYWNLTSKFKHQKNDKGEKYYITKLQEILEKSVLYRMNADVPIGSFLSGGVDSSVLTAIMANNINSKVNTYTAGFPEEGFNEFCYASTVAEIYQTRHHEIKLDSTKYLQHMEDLICIKDAPLAVPNEVALYLMSQKLKEKVSAVLSGEGADELFGGYGRIFRSTDDYLKKINLHNLDLSEKEKADFVNSFFTKYKTNHFNSEIEHFLNIYSYTSFEDQLSLLHSEVNAFEGQKKLKNKIEQCFEELKDDSYLNKMMYFFEKIHLVGLLQRVDTTTMAASVEARVPFLDHNLVEFACTIPWKYKMKWQENGKAESAALISHKISEYYDTPKYLLKTAYKDLLPDEILFRKKVGFPVPLNKWLNSSLNTYAQKLLLSQRAINRKLYNTDKIKSILNDDQGSSSWGMQIWMLINIELFCRHYFDEDKI